MSDNTMVLKLIVDESTNKPINILKWGDPVPELADAHTVINISSADLRTMVMLNGGQI
jgi:hypothetical protein